jgi:hypothetical protein
MTRTPITMDPSESFEIIVRKIKESNLHYILSENAFSVEIKIRKKFINLALSPKPKSEPSEEDKEAINISFQKFSVTRSTSSSSAPPGFPAVPIQKKNRHVLPSHPGQTKLFPSFQTKPSTSSPYLNLYQTYATSSSPLKSSTAFPRTSSTGVSSFSLGQSLNCSTFNSKPRTPGLLPGQEEHNHPHSILHGPA